MQTLDVPARAFKHVPNQQPTTELNEYRLAIVGEAPGADEEAFGKPFIGTSGRLLDRELSTAKIIRSACFVGNVCQTRPPGNHLAAFAWDSEEIQSGLARLSSDLIAYRPNLVLCLGGAAFHAFKSNANVGRRKGKDGIVFSFPNSIGDWRGSMFAAGSDSPLPHVKCLAAYHPAACLRQYEWTPLLRFDLIRARREAMTAELTLPQRRLEVDLTVEETLDRLRRIKLDKPLIALDIEGGIGTMSCISFATSATEAFIVPLANLDGSSYYTNSENELLIWKALADVLCDEKIPKVLQNSLYDRFVLEYSYSIPVRGVVDDTMLKHWELYSELEKSLGFQCSLYTDEPFYKGDHKSNDRRTFYEYCCRDSAVTWEINDKLNQFLTGPKRKHYEFNIDVLNPMMYMETRGIKYDKRLARERLVEVDHQIHELQYDLDEEASIPPIPLIKSDAIAMVQAALCYKRDVTRPLSGCNEAYDKSMRLLLGDAKLTKAQLGYLNIALGRTMNIKSAEFKTYLYETLRLPTQYKHASGAITTDYEALLKLTKLKPHRAVDLALQISALRTRSQMLSIDADKDGRIRAGYNVVGTETGRITCYTSPTGSGYNLQTIPAENTLLPLDHPLRKGMRDLFVADDGHYLFQCDLSGADGWTVAAHLAQLGDRTMLDDMQYGIKPAKVLCYLLRNGASALQGCSRAEIKRLTASVEKDSWDYFACKIGQHGTSYLMGKRRLADQIFVQSEGKKVMTERETELLQRLFTVRYRVSLWHNDTQTKLKKQAYPPRLESASGHTRIFFGRYDEILGEALANEPQENTTYATNLAATRLWADRRNHRIRPLHQVHDALVGQFPIADVEDSLKRIREYFNNVLIIAGIPIVIPFEGQYGTNWALDKASKVGDI